jgi:Asp-tRNA(Asn)/Glu-tRNA(Gln) amidotransferase A subunit family amidase
LNLIPLRVPDFPIDILSLTVEAAVFFDELTRSGRDKLLTAKAKGDRFRSARLIPAVEYLQSQRLRSIMMQELADATAGVDAYLAPSTNGNPRAGGADGPPPTGAPATPAPPPNFTQKHYQMANLACYPAVALPNGFTPKGTGAAGAVTSPAGTPTSIIFMGRPFGELDVMTLAKAYQDATGFNTQHPPQFRVG